MPSETQLDREIGVILQLSNGEPARAFEILERQLSVLVMRTQVLLSLCGIVITVTGFSGRAIAQTSASARILIAAGIFVVLVAAAVAIAGVLRLQWLTQVAAGDTRTLLREGLEIRQRKSRFLSAALAIFIAGFSCYVLAIVQLLLDAKPG